MATGDVNGVVNVLQTQNTLISQLVKALTTANALLVSGITVKPLLSATSQSHVAAPTAPASTSTYFMQGLAGAITPISTGTVLLIISGVIVSAAGTAGDGIAYQLSIGVGTAPANAGALAGTQVGSIQTYTNQASVTAADVSQPFSIQAIVTGLSVGIVHWLDLAAKSIVTASDVGLTVVSITAVEQ